MLPPTYTSQLQENPPQNGSFNKFEAPCFSPHFQGDTMNKMEGGPLPNLAAVSNGAFPQMSMPLPLIKQFDQQCNSLNRPSFGQQIPFHSQQGLAASNQGNVAQFSSDVPPYVQNSVQQCSFPEKLYMDIGSTVYLPASSMNASIPAGAHHMLPPTNPLVASQTISQLMPHSFSKTSVLNQPEVISQNQLYSQTQSPCGTSRVIPVNGLQNMSILEDRSGAAQKAFLNAPLHPYISEAPPSVSSAPSSMPTITSYASMVHKSTPISDPSPYPEMSVPGMLASIAYPPLMANIDRSVASGGNGYKQEIAGTNIHGSLYHAGTVSNMASPQPSLTSLPPSSGLPSMPHSMGPPQMNQPYGANMQSMNYSSGAPPVTPDMTGPISTGIQHQKSRLDPNLMPSLVQVMEEDRSTRSGAFPTGYPNAEHPPLTSTEFFAQDQGNCNPKFMRSSLYIAPATSDILKHSQIPFVVAISPFAPLHPNEYRLPVIDCGEIGPIRCHRCKAYMCPFMEFQDGGRRFRCSFCLTSTEVHEAYFAHLDHTGRRTDICNRPEQFLGSYEFVATTHYCKNGAMPKEPAFIFMLDVSYSAVQSGLVSIFCRNIRSLLNSLPRESGQEKSSIRVGFATYDQAVHFYNLKNVAEQPEMLVVSDVNDVFVPFVDGFFVTVDEANNTINNLLTEIEKMFAETRCTETILGPVIQAGLDALKCADRAGKLFVFHTNLPLFDAPGKLKNRDDRKLLGSEKEKIILQPGTDFYSKLAEECVKNGCAVDLFLFPNSYIDVASLAPICVITGGTMYKYHYFEGPKDGSRFLADLAHDISRDIAFDAMMRVRTSTGLRATNFCGSFYMDNSTDMEMGVIDSDKAVHVELRHDDKLPDGSAYIQTAILFTTCSGQRRLRIHNIALAVSSEYSHLYRLADPDCLVSFLLKQAEFLVREKTPQEMRDAITHRCAQMLATYREKCNEQVPVGQLILPESLKLLPLFGNCIIKNDAVSGGNDMTVDDRSWMMQMICSLRIEDALLLLYPSVFPVSDIVLEQPNDEVSMPAYIRASFDNFSHDKAYIIYNGIIMFLWIGLQVPQTWIQDIFNSNSVSHLNVENHIIPERDNTSSRGLRRIIDRINSGRARYMKLFIIRQQDALEAWMKKFLVEDRSSAMPSYVDFLCNIHREIRTLLS